MRPSIAAFGALCLSASAFAQTIDGTVDVEYGPPASVQNVGTDFGNSDLGVIDWANGSELDVGHAFVSGGYLYLFLGGNLESNYNKLEVFIDCKAGGQNRLRGDNRDVDYNGLNRMGDDGSANGLTFDEGFAADYWLGVTCGGPTFTVYSNCSELLTDGGEGAGGYLGAAGAGVAMVAGNGIEIALNNSNIGGVPFGSDAASGKGVTTGVEFKIPVSVLGYTDGPIRVCAIINGGGHDFVSNQVLGGCGAGQDFLGEPRNVNFNNVAGDQWFVVPGTDAAPCPADLNSDGVVDGTDLGLLLGDWGVFGSPADINQDGTVDGTDLGLLLGGWGNCG